MESVDTYNGGYRTIGKLSHTVRIPERYFVWGGLILILPDKDCLPSYYSNFHPGNMYFIPEVNSNGRYQMERYGPTHAQGL